MRRMFRLLLLVTFAACAWPGLAALAATDAAGAPASGPALTEKSFRQSMGFPDSLRMSYRSLACEPATFDVFAAQMREAGAHAEVDKAVDGSAITLTVRKRGLPRCASPYPPITSMPSFDFVDLAGKRVTSASLRGKPTLLSFYFAKCVPCIREVEPLNRIAAARPQMNFLAVTFDSPEEARGFVKRFGVRWRVVPDAQEFIDRMRVKNYPMLALFAADGRLLGTRAGGARDELEAANVEPQVTRWMDSLLRQ